MTKMPVRGWLALTAVVGAAACSPPVLPQPDASDDAAATDSMSRPDVAADSTNRPDAAADSMSRPDSAPDAAPDADAPDAAAEAGMDAAVEAGMDASMPPADASPDAAADGSRPDSAPDAADGSAPGCGLTVDGTITLPAPGMSTTVSTMLNPMGTGGMIGSYGCVSSAAGSERIYRMTVAARTEVIVRATAANADTDTVLAIRRNCTDMSAASEVSCNDDGGIGANSLIRTFLDPGDYFIIVDEYSFAATDATGGAVTLQVDTLGPADANSTCAMATPAMGMAVTGNNINGAVPASTCNSSFNGPQLFYSYTIPANTLGTFAVAPTGMPASQIPYVRVFADCASASTCLATAEGTMAGATTTATFENRSAMARSVIVSVGSTEVGSSGSFTLTGTVTALPPAPANATCAMPEALALPAMGVMGTTTGAFERRTYSSCSTSATSGAPLVYYSVTVPPSRTLQFRATPTSMTFNPAIRAFIGCSATTCADSRDAAPAGQAETLLYYNPTGGDQTLTIAVGSQTSGNQGDFTVDASLLPAAAPTNTNCAAAQALSAGNTPAQVQAQATGITGATCLATLDGPVLYYSVTVPNNTLATLTATPNSDRANAVLRVRPSCADTSCVGSTNATGAGSAETVGWRNTSGAPVTYIVEVGSTSNSTRGVFDLNLTLTDASPRYMLTALPMANCEDLSAAPAIMFSSTDDSATPVTALPAGFTFPFFADSMNTITHYSVTTNGYAQLWTSAAGSPSTSYFPGALDFPSASNPPGMLSIFWDDLVIPATGSVRTLTVGAMPSRRFVIEWTNVAPLGRSSTDTLRFQIKLSETSGIIEYHYCSMTSTDPMSTVQNGSGAVIGLQNIPRTLGQMYLANGTDNGMMSGMPRSIGGGTATSPNLLRWIPTM
ncbi:MAG: hypothetical protein U0269_28030 [Polyangiales bacterium]